MQSMKVFVLSPNAETFFSKNDLKKIKSAGDLILVKNLASFSKVPGLFEGGNDRVLAIDPDFCEWKFPNEDIKKIPHLKAICLQTTSYNWIDIDVASKSGVPVINIRDWATQAVVEWIITMSLCLSRRIPLMIKEGWVQDFNKYQGREMRGKTAGILGMGNIGKKLGETCLEMGMKVIYWSNKSRNKKFTYKPIKEVIKNSDYIFPVWLSNLDTKKLLPISLIKQVKPTCFWVDINMAQDSHDRNVLIKLVAEKKLGGYSFETNELKFSDFKGNVMPMPAMAWCTDDSIKRSVDVWSDAIIKATKGIYTNRVN